MPPAQRDFASDLYHAGLNWIWGTLDFRFRLKEYLYIMDFFDYGVYRFFFPFTIARHLESVTITHTRSRRDFYELLICRDYRF